VNQDQERLLIFRVECVQWPFEKWFPNVSSGHYHQHNNARAGEMMIMFFMPVIGTSGAFLGSINTKMERAAASFSHESI
jgi:hypothetical protein